MDQIKIKKRRRNKNSKRYKKPKSAIGCKAFGGRTFAEAKRLVNDLLVATYFSKLHQECAGNVSEMARRADMERPNIRTNLRRMKRAYK